MSFSSTPFSGSAFSDLGVIAVSVETTLPTNVLTLGTPSVSIAIGTVLPTLNGQFATPTLTVVGTATTTLDSTNTGATVSLGSIDVNITTLLPTLNGQFATPSLTTTGDATITFTNIIAVFDTGTYDNSLYSETSFTPELQTLLGTITVQGNVDFTIDSTNIGLTSSLGTITVTGTGLTTLPSNLLTLGTPSVSVIGTAFNTLPSLELVTNTPSGITTTGTAVATLPTINTNGIVGTPYFIIFNADSYSRDRVVYVDFKDNYIKNVVTIEEQDRTVYIDKKPYLITTTVNIPEQNRTVYIREKQHELQSKIARAA